MTRYFMTIPEASMLVLRSAALGNGGEIFVLDMGKPVKIVDLARRMIELSGLKPDEDIQIEFIGVRPGEKLFEELSHEGENFLPTAHAKILRLVSEPCELAQVQNILNDFGRRMDHAGAEELKRMLRKAVPEYAPQSKTAADDCHTNGDGEVRKHKSAAAMFL
jgi:FlaA1/EpsC-like NDP-sugar epimerase